MVSCCGGVSALKYFLDWGKKKIFWLKISIDFKEVVFGVVMMNYAFYRIFVEFGLFKRILLAGYRKACTLIYVLTTDGVQARSS